MTFTSQAATAPVPEAAASRRVPSRNHLAYGWRVLRTGVAFVSFGLGAIVVAAVVRVCVRGTRSPRGGLRRFQRGAAHIALKSGCPIVPIVVTCRPPTLVKGQPWHDVADRRSEYVLRVGEPIDPGRYLSAATTVPLAARRLTADLQALFEQGLGADE